MKYLNNQRGFAMLIELVLVVILLGSIGFIGYKVFTAKKPAGKTAVATSKDCGTVDASQSSGEFDSSDSSKNKFQFEGPNAETFKARAKCFDDEFAKCQVGSTYVVDLAGSITTKYTIAKKATSGCDVTYRFTKLEPNPSWENKDITCNYDNKKTFEDALNEQNGKELSETGCTGPLVDLMNSQ